MEMTDTVLIGFAEALAAIESAWSLQDDGFEVVAFGRRGSRPALGRAAGVRILDITPPEQDAQQAAAELAAMIQEINPAAVLPLDDQAVWLCDRVFSESALTCRDSGIAQPVPARPSPARSILAEPLLAGVPETRSVLAGPLGLAATLSLDKREQLLAAAAAGFAVPESRAAATEEPAGPGPWMVKPALAVELRAGRLHRPGGQEASKPTEVREIAVAIGGPAIAQPLITGTGEGIFGLATPSGIVALSAHRRIRMMNPRGSGSSACRSIPVATELIGPVREFVTRSGLLGLFMIEFLRDETGTPWFMELNGRAWGSMALACRRGFAYPAWAVRAALTTGFMPAEPGDGPQVTARHLGREIVHVGAVLTRGGAPRLRTVRDVLTVRRNDRWYNWRRGQPTVFAADALATVRSQLRRGRSS
jgi:hypothetical protein